MRALPQAISPPNYLYYNIFLKKSQLKKNFFITFLKIFTKKFFQRVGATSLKEVASLDYLYYNIFLKKSQAKKIFFY